MGNTDLGNRIGNRPVPIGKDDPDNQDYHANPKNNPATGRNNPAPDFTYGHMNALAWSRRFQMGDPGGQTDRGHKENGSK